MGSGVNQSTSRSIARSVHAPCELRLLPERAVWWPEERTLLVADLHLGKGATFRSAGACLPADGDEEQLARLGSLVDRLEVHRLIVLGDLIHAPIGVTAELLDRVASWRAKLGVEVALVPGNHDRDAARLAEAWDLELTPSPSAMGPLELVHDPAESSGGPFFIAGHIHPVVCLRGGGDALRLPCFVEHGPSADSAGGLVIPAFSSFTGGAPVDLHMTRSRSGVIHAIADDRVERV